MKINILNESSLVDKKVNTLGKSGKPMYFTTDQLKDAEAKYPEYNFKEISIDKSLPQGQKAYLAKKITTENVDDSVEANKMTIMPLAGLNSDGFTVVINDAAGEELFKKEYRYGHNASYDRRFAQWAEKDHNDSIKYGWKNPRALKPYVADIVDELCSKYGIDKNSIEFVPGKNIFNGNDVTSDFVDSIKKKVYEENSMTNESLLEGIEIDTIADYITDNYTFETIDDKYSCIDSIKYSFRYEKTISKEELEQFIGAHNGKDKVNESKSIKESKATHCVYFTQDGMDQIEFEGTEEECADYLRNFDEDEQNEYYGDEWPERYIKKLDESMKDYRLQESGISDVEPKFNFQGKSSHTFTKDKKWEVDFDEAGNILARTRHGKPSYFKGHINDKTNDFPSTDEDNIILAAREQHGLKFDNKEINESLSPREGDRVQMDFYAKDNNGATGTCTGRVGELCFVKWDDGTKSKEIKGYLKVIERPNMNEASYGGAFDIADDQIFTREDIDNLAEEVLNHINETFNEKFEISAAYIDGNELEVAVENEDLGEYLTTLKIDMRKVREPWHLKKVYSFEVASDLINQISRSMNDSKELNESSDSEEIRKIRIVLESISKIEEELYSLPRDWREDFYLDEIVRKLNNCKSEIKDKIEDEMEEKDAKELISEFELEDIKIMLEATSIENYKEDAELWFGKKVPNICNEVLQNIDTWKDYKVAYFTNLAEKFYLEVARYAHQLGEPLNESATEDAQPIQSGADVGMATIISDLIKDEYEAIDGYNSAIATAELEGFEDMISVLTDIQAEENIHIGQLQTLMNMVDPNSTKIEDGVEEAKKELADETFDDDSIDFFTVDDVVDISDDDINDEDVENVLKSIEKSMKIKTEDYDIDVDDDVVVESAEPWEDIYNSFKNIEVQLNGDGEAITATIDRIYNDNKGNPDFEKAYKKWAANE